MEGKTSDSKVHTNFTRNCLVVPLQVELSDTLILQVQDDVLEAVNKSGVRGVVIDISAVNIIDSFIANTILDTVKMVSLLGASTVLVGLKPGVVVSLIDLEVDVRNVLVAGTLEDGFRLLRPIVEPDILEDDDAEKIVDEADVTGAQFNDGTEGDEVDDEDGWRGGDRDR